MYKRITPGAKDVLSIKDVFGYFQREKAQIKKVQFLFGIIEP